MKNYYTIEMRISTDKIPDLIKENLSKKFNSKKEVLHALQKIGAHYPLEILRVKWIEHDQDEINIEKLTADAFFALFSPTTNLDI